MNFGAKSAHAFVAVLFIGLFGIAAEAQRTFRAVLDGAQEVPPVTGTTATGIGTVVLNSAETQITVNLQFSGLTTAQTLAHIHGPAARGAATGVAISLPNGQITNQVFPITPTQVADLKAGLMYFNIHTAMFGGGEIRGQIEPDCATLPSGLISWYPGEGNPFDIQSGINGTLQNGTTFAAGRVGRAFSFDGIDDYVEVPSNPAQDPTTAATLDAWLRFNQTPSAAGHIMTFISKGASGSDLDLIALTDNKFYFYISNGANVASTTVIQTGVWYHVAGTWNATGLRIYVNGVLENTNPTANITRSQNGAPLRLGESAGFAPRRMSGLIDEAEIFNRALSAAEVEAIFNAGAAGKCPNCTPAPVGLTNWWTADGNTFDVRNRHNGTLLNGTTYAEGNNGHAFSFDGGDDRIDVAHNPIQNTGVITIDAWINQTTVGHGRPIAQKRTSGSVGGYTFETTHNPAGNPNGLAMCVWVGGTASCALTPANVLTAGVWQHVAGTYDGSTIRVYVDGTERGSLALAGSIDPSVEPIVIGRNVVTGAFNFHGRIDEIEIFNRALSATEIAAIANAGRSCKCKPTATTAPANLVGWWGGDGDTRDISGTGNNGTLQGGAGFRVGRVGQSFNFDGIDDSFQVPHNANQNISGSFTGEAWIFPRSSGPSGSPRIFEKFDAFVGGFWLMSFGDGVLANNIALNITGNNLSTNSNTVPLNQWSHVAFTYNGTSGEVVFYINGVSATGNIGAGLSTSNTSPLFIGNNAANGRQFDGLIDEPSIYNRVLTQAEIASIFNAGLAGKLKNAATPIGFAFGEEEKGRKGEGENKDVIPTSVPATEDGSGLSPQVVNVTVGDATVTFPTVTTAGTTQEIPLSLSGLPPLPFVSTGLTYDISTSAVFTGSPTVCFNLPGLMSTPAANLRILHLENGNWVNRTAAGGTHSALCTTGLTSLSPFAITNSTPTAASVSISGRVMTANGRGISRARVTITDPDGVSRTAITNAFGYYRFDEIEVGRTYVVSARHKRYQFADRIVSVEDELTDLDFVPIE